MADQEIKQLVAQGEVRPGRAPRCRGGECLLLWRRQFMRGHRPDHVQPVRDRETAEPSGRGRLASLGCGNPTALAELRAGETVLDLGSGGGIDVLLSARRVGPTGKAYGLDMTDEMLALAERTSAKAGVENVEFLKGEIEQIPLPDGSVDVIISNCVINLSADKDRVLAEAFRVLKPGGRFAVSDVVVRGEMPARSGRACELWIGCVAGALERGRVPGEAGEGRLRRDRDRADPNLRAEEAREFLSGDGIDVDAIAPEVDGKFMSAFLRAASPPRRARCSAPITSTVSSKGCGRIASSSSDR